MVKINMAGEIMVAFKPEVKQSEIEKMLSGYTYAKVFDKGEFDSKTDREGQVMARLYSLLVTPGEEANVLTKLKKEYGISIEMAYEPHLRKNDLQAISEAIKNGTK